MIKAIKSAFQITVNEVRGQLWGKEGQEVRNFLTFHGLNILWGIGEIIGTVLFYPFFMAWLLTIICLIIPEFREIGYILLGGYVFAFITMRIEAKRYYFEKKEVEIIEISGDCKPRKVNMVLKFCKYSGYRVKAGK